MYSLFTIYNLLIFQSRNHCPWVKCGVLFVKLNKNSSQIMYHIITSDPRDGFQKWESNMEQTWVRFHILLFACLWMKFKKMELLQLKGSWFKMVEVRSIQFVWIKWKVWCELKAAWLNSTFSNLLGKRRLV